MRRGGPRPTADPTADPGGETVFDLVPVDHVRAAVVALTLRPDTVGRTFHIAADQRLGLDTAVGWLRAPGHRITATTGAAWAAHVEAHRLPTGPSLLATVRDGGAETALRYEVSPSSRHR